MMMAKSDQSPLQDQALPDLEHKSQVAAENAANRRKARNREQLLGQRAQNPFTQMQVTTGPSRTSRARHQAREATREPKPSIAQPATTAQPSTTAQQLWMDSLLASVAEAYSGDNNNAHDNEPALRNFCHHIRRELPRVAETRYFQGRQFYERIKAIIQQLCKDLEYAQFLHSVDTPTDIHEEVESPPTLLVHRLVISPVCSNNVLDSFYHYYRSKLWTSCFPFLRS